MNNSVGMIKFEIGSSSTDPIDDRYDVFLSFRGADTRNSFTDHLYHKLIGAGISTFRDDEELEKGETLKQQLDKAIKESSVSIIIFSEDYASSSWCLNEVVRILEQKKLRSNHKVLPIFYHLEVSDVRYQKGSYEKAFHRHMEKGYVSLEKIEAWKAALSEAADLSGFALNKDKGEPETEFIGKIMCEVEKSLPNRKALYLSGGLVGMNDRVTGIESWLTDRSKDNKILVICGIGGIGKTTIATHLFNKYFQEFEGSCFLARITTTWAQEGVCVLQSQLFSDIRNEKEEIRIYNSDKGTLKIKKAICNRKILVVLDDVSEIEQFEALLGQPQRLCPGSKIIVTTRNMSLVKDFTVDTKVDEIGGLDYDHSLELFSLHAFRQGHPPEEYEQLSEEILRRCEGHPLALKVLGSALYKEDAVFWELQLKKWNNVIDDKIQKVMQISYNSLKDDTVKNLFLHVACFFVGEEEDYVVKILDHCGLHATVGIRNLIGRCLITVHEKKVMMHKVIQDMGHEIVRQEYPNEPGKRSRLWYHEDSFNVLKYDKGSEAVQGFILDGQKINKAESARSIFAANDANSHLMTRLLGRFLPSEEGKLIIDAFAKMVNLKFVKLRHVHLTGRCNNFPKELRWISWHRFPLEYVPMELLLENLVALDLQHSLLKQVWKGYMEVKSLKFLNLSYSLELYQTPDFRGLLQLEKLILRGCSNLVKVCRSIGILKGLVSLDLSNCKSLRDLPGLPESLLSLNLSGCSHLGEFSGKQQIIKPSYWYGIVKYVSPSISTGPFKLPSNLPHLLKELNLEGCNLSDKCFPREFCGLSSLERLDLSGNLITRLPDCVSNLPSSRPMLLKINNCPQLQSVIHPPRSVLTLSLRNNIRLEKTNTRMMPKYFWLKVDESTRHIENEGCFKLVDTWDVDGKVLKNLGLKSVPISNVGKVLYQLGIFSTFVLSIARVPRCFKSYYISYTDKEDDSGSIDVPSMGIGTIKLRYMIPSSYGRSVQGLNICVIRSTTRIERSNWIEVTVCNKTKDLAWTYFYDEYHANIHIRCEKLMWVSTWKFIDLFEPGDEIEVSFRIRHTGWMETVKEFGIRTVYEEEEETSPNLASTNPVFNVDEKSLFWSDEMDFSISDYRTAGTHYFLIGRFTHHPFMLEDIEEEEIDGRAVQFVDWWGPVLNRHSKEGKVYFRYHYGVSYS